MTAQIDDTCFHRKINFAIIAVFREAGPLLFEVDTLGLPRAFMSTGCWRGYVARYAILNKKLFLIALQIRFAPEVYRRSKTGNGPELFGVLPTQDGNTNTLYAGFRLPIPFTGSLTLAKGIIEKYYSHLGMQRTWQYRWVRKVTFEAGGLVADLSRTREMEAIRACRAVGKIHESEKKEFEELRRFLEGDI